MKELITRVEFVILDKLLVSDPCYVDKNDAQKGIVGAIDDLGLLLDDCGGKWVAEVTLNLHNRVTELHVTRMGYVGHSETMCEMIVISVDSGQIFVGCASMFGLDYDDLLDRYKLPDGKWDDHLQFFGFGEGAVSGTTYGDGFYPVYVTRDYRGLPIKIQVCFDEDEELKVVVPFPVGKLVAIK